MRRFFLPCLANRLWSWPMVKLLLGQARKRGLRGLAELVRAGAGPGARLAGNRLTNPKRMQALFAPWVLHTGLDPKAAYSGADGQGHRLCAGGRGRANRKGRRGCSAFRPSVRLIEENGGEVRLNADVDRISVQWRRVTGVRLADGEEIACQSVLASVTPDQLYRSAAGWRKARPKTLRPHENSATVAANFQLHYALDAPPEWLSPGLEKVGLDPSGGRHRFRLEISRTRPSAGCLPAVPTICVGQPSRAGPNPLPDREKRCCGCKSPMLRASSRAMPRAEIAETRLGHGQRGLCRPHRDAFYLAISRALTRSNWPAAPIPRSIWSG